MTRARDASATRRKPSRKGVVCSLFFAGAATFANACGVRAGDTQVPDVPALAATETVSADERPGSPDGLVFSLRPPPSDLDPNEAVGTALHHAEALMHLMQSEALDPAMLETVGGPNQGARLLVDRAFNLAWAGSAPSAAPQTRRLDTMSSAGTRTQRPGYVALHILNSGVQLEVQLYDAQGRMRPTAVDELSLALRDLRAGEVHSIDTRVLAMLYQVAQHYDANIRIVSGYRVSGVNATRGSRHGSGRAIDFSVDGVSGWRVATWIESNFANIGVGVYPTSGFVHMDTRRPSYFWVDRSGPRQRSRTSTRTPARRIPPQEDGTILSPHVPPIIGLNVD